MNIFIKYFTAVSIVKYQNNVKYRKITTLWTAVIVTRLSLSVVEYTLTDPDMRETKTETL